jgi:hypothetical protein
MNYTKKFLMGATLGLAGLMAIPASAQYSPWGNNNGGWQDRHDDHDRDRDRNRNGNWGWQDRDDDRYNRGGYGNGRTYSHDSENQAYQQGYRDGLSDRQNGPQRRTIGWKHDYDANAYRDGYNDGMNGNRGNNGNGRWGRNNGNGNGRWGRNNGSWDNRGGYGNGSYGNGTYGNGSYGNGGYARQGYIDGVNDGSRDAQTGHSFRPTEQPGYKHADRGYNGQSGMSKDQYKQAYRDSYMQGYQRGYYNRR